MGKKIEIKYKGKVLETVDISATSLVLQYIKIESIRDVEGLDQLVNLEQLIVYDCGITRIEGLNRLVNLKQLSLDKNKITKIEGLDQLVNLKSLNLQDNKIAKIEGLGRLVNLKILELGRTEGYDRSKIGRGQIIKIEGLDQLVNLTDLDLGYNKITKIEGLDQLVKLEKLFLNGNKITRIEGLDQLVKLHDLFLRGNQITKLEGLDRLVNLKQLILEENQIAKIEGLDRLVNLTNLALGENQIVKFEGLDRLVNLERLTLGNKIAKIEGLDRLVNLERLDLGGNRVATVEDRSQPGDNKITLVQQTDTLADSENCEKMNLKAKKALKAKDIVTSANILNELVALCTRNLQTTRLVKDKYYSGYYTEHDTNAIYQKWKVVLESNLKLLEKAKKASQDPAGLTERVLLGIMKKWKDHAITKVLEQISNRKMVAGISTTSDSDLESSEKMNLKAKEALKANDFATSANILNELMAFCSTHDVESIHDVGGAFLSEVHENPRDWVAPLQTNLKIVEKAKRLNQGSVQLSKQEIEKMIEKWEDRPRYQITIPHAGIPSKTKWRARIFALVGIICGFFIGGAFTNPLEGCLFAVIAGISMYLLVIAMTSNNDKLPSNTFLVGFVTAAFGGMGWLIDTLGGGSGLAGLSLGLKIGLLLGILQGLTGWEMGSSNHFFIGLFMAMCGGAGAGIGALIGLLSPIGAGYGACVGLFIAAPVPIFFTVFLTNTRRIIFASAAWIVIGLVIGAFSSVGVGMGAAWSLYIVSFAGVVLLLGLICIKYRKAKFPAGFNKGYEEAWEDSQPYKENSLARTIMELFVIPILLADGIFIVLGLLSSPFIPPSFTTMFWCALLIAGSIGLAISLFQITYIVEGGDFDIAGSFVGLIRVNGFVYAGELVWFLIVSLQLAGAVGIMILIQFIGQFCIALVFPTSITAINPPSKHKHV